MFIPGCQWVEIEENCDRFAARYPTSQYSSIMRRARMIVNRLVFLNIVAISLDEFIAVFCNYCISLTVFKE